MSFIVAKVRQLTECLNTVLGSTGIANRLGGHDALDELGVNVEALTLTGADTINGTGNAGGNLITGNAANNVLDSNNREIGIIGTTDKATLTNWYLGTQYHVEQFKTSDGKTLLDSQVQNLVDAMATFAPPAAGLTTLSASYAAALSPVIVANWQ